MRNGKVSILGGIIGLVLFMLSGYIFVYIHDFPTGESFRNWLGDEGYELLKIAHAHGNLFSILNILIGILLNRFQLDEKSSRWITVLGLLGLLMPAGIMARVFLGAPAVFILLGEIGIITAFVWLGLAIRGRFD